MNSTHDHLKAAIDPDATFVQDGNSYTSAGVTAGSDLAVALVESDLAGPLVLSVAREMVVCIKRCGGQLQFSEPLRFEARASDRFSGLTSFIVTNLSKDRVRHDSGCIRRAAASGRIPQAPFQASQMVDNVAASMGYRSNDAFRRAFLRRFGIAPSLYVEGHC